MIDPLGLLQRTLSVAGRLERLRVGEIGAGLAWRASGRFANREVDTQLHHRRVRMLYGNPYLRWMRRYPLYNAPLVELVHLTAQDRGRPVHVVDVGAAMGDTALLLKASCRDDIARITCVEADATFVEMLRWNTGHLPDVTVVSVLLTDGSGVGAELVRTHAGTASPQGAPAAGRPFDDVPEVADVDVLKVDTDGFDGRVLQGGAVTLARAQPNVLFEWHPVLLEATGSDPAQAFEVLDAAGYATCVWFSKDGTFSHVTTVSEAVKSCPHLASVCRDLGAADVHYDVVALPEGSSLGEASLAALGFSRRHRDPG